MVSEAGQGFAVSERGIDGRAITHQFGLGRTGDHKGDVVLGEPSIRRLLYAYARHMSLRVVSRLRLGLRRPIVFPKPIR